VGGFIRKFDGILRNRSTI
jgi:hypothetical protein